MSWPPARAETSLSTFHADLHPHATPSLVILAGDISPLDILSHLPVLCEEQDVPYIFVASKEALGAASSTKRPTSTVMIVPDGGAARAKNKKPKVEVKEEYAEEFESLAKEIKKLNEAIVLGSA